VGQNPLILGTFFDGVLQHITSYLLNASTMTASAEPCIDASLHAGYKTTPLYAKRCHRKSEILHFCKTVTNFLRVGDNIELKRLMTECK